MSHRFQLPTVATWFALALAAYFLADFFVAIAEREFRPEVQRMPTFQPTPLKPPNVSSGAFSTLLATTVDQPGNLDNVVHEHDSQDHVFPEFSLMGTLVGENGQGVAFIQVEAEMTALTPGDMVPDSAALVVKVEIDHIVLRHRDKEISVFLGETSSRPKNTRSPQPETVAPLPINQSEIRALLDRPDLIFQPGFKASPKIERGEMVGVVLTLPNEDHPLAMLGLESGDVLKAINQKPLNETGSLSKMLPILRNSSTLVIDLERQGHATTLTIDLD